MKKVYAFVLALLMLFSIACASKSQVVTTESPTANPKELVKDEVREKKEKTNQLYRNAEELLQAKDFEGAIAAFEELAAQEYPDADQRLEEAKKLQALDQQYRDAEKHFLEKDYDKAIALFEELEKQEYMDAAQRLLDVQFAKAKSLVEERNYSEAITLFEDLSKKGYANAQVEEYAARYAYANAVFDEGDINAAEIQFEYLSQVNYKDSKEQLEQINLAKRYNDAMALAEKGEYLNAVEELSSLYDCGYQRAVDGSREVFTKLTMQGEPLYVSEGLLADHVSTFWKQQYINTNDSADYDMLLLSTHNLLSNASKNIMGRPWTWDEGIPFIIKVGGYFDNMEAYYAALSASKYASKCADQCYDVLKLYGEWVGEGYFFLLTRENRLGFSLPVPDKSIGGYNICDHIMYFSNPEQTLDWPVFRINFVSDTKAEFYCYENNQTYILEKQS